MPVTRSPTVSSVSPVVSALALALCWIGAPANNAARGTCNGQRVTVSFLPNLLAGFFPSGDTDVPTANMVSFVASLFFSFLPRQWWGRWRPESTVQLRYAAFASGVLESLAMLPVLVDSYRLWVSAIPAEVGGSPHLAVTSFVLYTAGFLLQPYSLLLLVFVLEGAVRAIAAGITYETLPSLPLAMAASLGRRLEPILLRRKQKEPLPDRIEPVKGGLRIVSSRPKQDWHESITVAFGEELFDVTGEEKDVKAQRFVYELRPHLPGQVVRGLRRYDSPAGSVPESRQSRSMLFQVPVPPAESQFGSGSEQGQRQQHVDEPAQGFTDDSHKPQNEETGSKNPEHTE